MVHTNTNDSFIQKDTKTFSGGSKQINCVFRALIQKASNKIEVEKFQAAQITNKQGDCRKEPRRDPLCTKTKINQNS
jgi:hypothetical protein